MRIRDNLPPGSTARTAAAKPVARARNAEAASATSATSAAGVTAQADQATFLGLNETELSPNVRAALVALVALCGFGIASAAYGDSGRVHIRIVKAGFVIGGSGGSGTLKFPCPAAA